MLIVANFTVLADNSMPMPMTTFTFVAIFKSLIELVLIITVIRLGIQIQKDGNSASE